MGRPFAAVALVPVLVLSVGCAASVSDDDAATSSAWTAAQCKNIHQGYIACLQGTNEGYRDCVESAERTFVADLVDDLVGNVVAPLPCVSSQLGQILSARCFLSSSDGASIAQCVTSNALSLLQTYASVKDFTHCAGNLGAETAEGEKALAGYKAGLEKNALIFLATEAARITKFTVQYKTCAEELDSSSDACEPVACNRAKCTCFDAPSCPTIARCGGTQTHMTGIVDCGTIANGRATTNQGASVACTSWVNEAAPGCHGRATAGACH